MTAPRVSVIVPVFNVEKYLRECLDSILAQTLPDLEIICGDGGSTDGSLEVIQEYAEKDPRVSYITKKRSGYGQSVNECIDRAKGEYIGIVESDDAVEADMFETLYNLAKKHDLDWIRGDIYFYYSDRPRGKQLERESIIYDCDFYNRVLNPQADYRPYKSGLRTWSGIYKSIFLREYDIRHSETPGGSFQDVGFYLKTLYYAKRVYFVNQTFYKWRQDNPGSSVHYNSAKLVEKSLNEWKLNQQYLDEHPNIGSRAYASYNYRKFFSYRWTIDMAEGEDKLIVQRRGAEEFSNALKRGEIDRGFFDEREWNLFVDDLYRWKMCSDVLQPEQCNRIDSGTQNKCKQAIKRILRPLARFGKKIVHKLMGSVLFSIENDIASLRCHVDELNKETQSQIYENTTQMQYSLREMKELTARIDEKLRSLIKISEKCDSTENDKNGSL